VVGYGDDSSILPFSLNFGNVPANWTDPDPSAGLRKNNCIIELDSTTAEYKDVVGRYLQSIREGKRKYAEEIMNRIDSAAGEPLSSGFSIFIVLLKFELFDLKLICDTGRLR
jgi:hypothetical protein